MKQSQPLHIVFHNPNSPEETAKFLVRLLASSLAENVIRNGTDSLVGKQPISKASAPQ